VEGRTGVAMRTCYRLVIGKYRCKLPKWQHRYRRAPRALILRNNACSGLRGQWSLRAESQKLERSVFLSLRRRQKTGEPLITPAHTRVWRQPNCSHNKCAIKSTILMRKPFSFLPPLISKFPELCLFGHLPLFFVKGHDFPH